MNGDTEARLARLEENAYFQEEKIKSLDYALAAQQEEINALKKSLERTREALTRARDAIAAVEAKTATEETPPHFLQKPW